MNNTFRATALAAAICAIAAGGVQAQTQGVTKTEILIATVQDLSGPIASLGKTSRNGMMLRVDEVNEQGGIHGRKLRLITEDSGYDPKKAVMAAQKLARSDKVFLVAGSIGTAVAMASMPIYFENNIPHLFPLTSARQMYEPLHRLKYSFAATYYDQIRAAVRVLSKQKAERKWCALTQDDDFGVEVLQGAEMGLKENSGKALTEKTTYKRGATDFSSQAQKMQGAGCDTVVLGTIIRETVGVMAEARKLNWTPQFVGSSASYTHLVPQLAGAAANGYIAAHTAVHPYLDDAAPNIRFWANKYKTRFNENPDVFAAYGYMIADMVAQVLSKNGPALTTESFIKTLDSMTFAKDIFGGDIQSFTPARHLGSNKSRLSQIKDGRWVVITEYVEP